MASLQVATLGQVIRLLILAILFPLSGALVRIRAHYRPKRPRLQYHSRDASEGARATFSDTWRTEYVAPVPSFLGMLRRTQKIEGWAGLYKGFVPMLLAEIPVYIGTTIRAHYRQTNHPNNVLLEFAFKIIAMLVVLPFTVASYRAIVIPVGTKLSYFDIWRSVHRLFSAEERKQPLRLYLTPGLIAIKLIQTVHPFLVGYVLASDGKIPDALNVQILHLGIRVVFTLINAIVGPPLEAIAIRLMVQWSVEDSINNSALRKGNVVDLRGDQQSYTGLINCAKTIIAEEGYGTLYRPLWLNIVFTSMLSIGGAFATYQLYRKTE
ncbi:mitochondrial carrier domain-containing protein [Hygrophoropsis aurantiaca]|uniref:Mitochondrial carrier domain-containing protein n=1 Tax=Hygrophoropsis aurantiaca TaxID=72124 RepID=A0ACB8ATK3_9AGAM|nr:mitochondrial carrier domain-containing protein [Hygrophoropsis aurantiaca]